MQLGDSLRMRAHTSRHLLPSQAISVDDLPDDPNETDDSVHRRASRLRGGFSFPTPNDFLLHLDATIATYDITSGAVDGMCEALSSIITSDDAGVRINLLFSHEAQGVHLTSHLSQTGRLEIEKPKRSAATGAYPVLG